MTATTIPFPIVSDEGRDAAQLLVATRSGGWCEICASADADEWHPRKSLLHGGTWNPANLLHTCRSCNKRLGRVGSASTRYYRLGWCLRPGQDPTLVPAQINHGHRFGLFLLRTDGEYDAYSEVI